MTQDGGRTWTEIESDIWDNIRGLYFASDQEGWAVGDRGLITHTINGGRTWEHQKSGWWYTLTDVYFLNPEKGWVIGDLGTVLHTSDGGESWVKQTPGGFQMLKGVFFFDDHIGWVIGVAWRMPPYEKWWTNLNNANNRYLQRTLRSLLCQLEYRLDCRSVWRNSTYN